MHESVIPVISKIDRTVGADPAITDMLRHPDRLLKKPVAFDDIQDLLDRAANGHLPQTSEKQLGFARLHWIWLTSFHSPPLSYIFLGLPEKIEYPITSGNIVGKALGTICLERRSLRGSPAFVHDLRIAGLMPDSCGTTRIVAGAYTEEGKLFQFSVSVSATEFPVSDGYRSGHQVTEIPTIDAVPAFVTRAMVDSVEQRIVTPHGYKAYMLGTYDSTHMGPELFFDSSEPEREGFRKSQTRAVHTLSYIRGTKPWFVELNQRLETPLF